MSSRDQKMQHFIREWMKETGRTDIDMHEVAKYARSKGFRAPKVPTEIDLLARDFSRVAREQHRTDEQTGRSYRVYHAFKHRQGDTQLTLWIDIDVAPRNKMWKSLQNAPGADGR